MKIVCKCCLSLKLSRPTIKKVSYVTSYVLEINTYVKRQPHIKYNKQLNPSLENSRI